MTCSSLSRASVVITDAKLAAHEHNGTALLLCPNPRLAFAQVGHMFYPPAPLIEGIAPTLQVHPTAKIGPGTQIAQGVEIRANAVIGATATMSSS